MDSSAAADLPWRNHQRGDGQLSAADPRPKRLHSYHQAAPRQPRAVAPTAGAP